MTIQEKKQLLINIDDGVIEMLTLREPVEAIKKDYRSIAFTPQTEELQLLAIKINKKAYKYIDKPTRKVILKISNKEIGL